MALVTAPYMSMQAMGTIANALTAQRRGNRTSLTAIPRPTDRKTDAQLAQRQKFLRAVQTWSQDVTDPHERQAWNRVASNKRGKQSGHNAFVGSVLRTITTHDNPGFSTKVERTIDTEIRWNMINAETGEPSEEIGEFNVWAGRTAHKLELVESIEIVDGTLTTTNYAGTEDNRFMQITYDGDYRSGIVDTYALPD